MAATSHQARGFRKASSSCRSCSRLLVWYRGKCFVSGLRKAASGERRRCAPQAGTTGPSSGAARALQRPGGHGRAAPETPAGSLRNKRLLLWWWPEKIKKGKSQPSYFSLPLCFSRHSVYFAPAALSMDGLSLGASWVLYNAKHSYWHFTKNLE